MFSPRKNHFVLLRGLGVSAANREFLLVEEVRMFEKIRSATFLPSHLYNVRPMDAEILKQLVPGATVKVIQQIAARNHTWTTEVRGTIVEYAQKETGSWFAHSRDDKLWLDRLVIKKSDGEITTLILDDYSNVEVEAATSPVVATTETKDETPQPA